MTAVQAWLADLPKRPARLAGIAAGVVYVLYSYQQAGDVGVLFSFTVIGIAEGAVFAIAASGLVLTYATTGVFNFGHGAVGMISAYLYYALRIQHDVPVPLALFLILFVFAPLIGFALEWVMRRFKDAPVQTTVVVTIAVTVMLIGISTQAFPPETAAKLPPLLKGETLKFLSATPTRDNVLALVVAAGVAIGLRFLLFTSRTGTAMRAVVDNPDLAALNGAPPVAIARYSWMLGSMLAALAGVLLGSGLNLEPVGLTFFVAGAYGAAVVGKLKSLPLTFAGAIALGIIKNFSNFNFPDGSFWTSIKTSIPSVFLILALLLVPAAKLSVGRIVGTTAPKVPNMVSSWVRGGVFVAVMFFISRAAPSEHLADMTRALIFALLLLSLVVLTGLSGQTSLCQYVFLGMGAWAMGHTFGGASPFGMVAAGLVAIPLGIIVALPALRLQGLYLALVTFAVAAAADTSLFENPNVYGGGNVAVGRLKLLGYSFGDDRSFFVLCAIVFALFGIGVLAIKRGRLGRRLAALRDSQAACATLGLDVRRTKLMVFSISAFIAGVAGALIGGLAQTAGSIQFKAEYNLVLLLFAVVGGVTTVTGAFIGGALFALLPFVAAEYPEYAGVPFAVIAFGAVALGRQPNGLAGVLYDRVSGFFATLMPDRRRADAKDMAPASQEVVGAPA
jgi:branched-chain amino acid transport system permease protein